MGLRITKGKKKNTYNVYCTIVDKFLGKNEPKQEVIDWYIERQKQRAKDEIERWLDEVDAGIRPHRI